VAAEIPRRPEVPGAPGVALPKPHLVGIREEMSWRPRDDDEPTNPYPRDPRRSGLIATELPLTNGPASSRHSNRVSDRPPPSLPAASGPVSSRAVVHNGPPSSGRGPDSSSSLTVPNLTRVDAAQLAGIIAAWETADEGGRTLLAEFAKRLGRTPQK
jgi:hypothetical protein